jgi:hypothetical protein
MSFDVKLFRYSWGSLVTDLTVRLGSNVSVTSGPTRGTYPAFCPVVEASRGDDLLLFIVTHRKDGTLSSHIYDFTWSLNSEEFYRSLKF